MGLVGFDSVSLEEIKDSERGDWESGSDLQNIRTDTGTLNSSIYADLAISTDETYAGDLNCNNLIIYNGGRVNASGYNVTVFGDLTGKNARIVCLKLEVFGDINIGRLAGDSSYTNLFHVEELICHGNVILDYCDWQLDQSGGDGYYYDGTGVESASTIIQKINGNFTITNDLTSGQRWFCTQTNIEGDFYIDSDINVTTVSTGLLSVEFAFQWSINGDCEFNGVTNISINGCQSGLNLSIIGEIIFSESAVTFEFNGIDGEDGNGFSSGGEGGGYLAGAGRSGGVGPGGDATYNGGGGGALDTVSTGYSGGAGANRGGNGGGASHGTGGGGGGGTPDFNFYYGIGDTGTTLSINCIGGIGGDADGGSNADGGSGGDSGDLTITYDSTPMGTLTPGVSGGSGGSGIGSGSSGSTGSAGSSSHTSGQSPLVIHLPEKPTFVTATGTTTASIEFNVPVDINGTNLDFEILVEEKISDTTWLGTYDHNSNDDSSYFSGSPPYTEGTGTVTYTPPSADLTSGTTYRTRVSALKDTVTTLQSIYSDFIEFVYP